MEKEQKVLSWDAALWLKKLNMRRSRKMHSLIGAGKSHSCC